MSKLILSIFPGLDVLGMGFEAEGWCVVRGPDVLWGSDIRDFHAPPGVFDGVIGGDPCQSHSSLANLVRAKGLETRFGDLSSEYKRIVEEARPRWFLRENVMRAPDVKPSGYEVMSFVLDNAEIDRGDGVGEPQRRSRRFWFGVSDLVSIDLGERIPRAVLRNPEPKQSVTGRHTSIGMGGTPGITPGNKAGNPPRYSLAEMLELQNLPADLFEHSPFTKQGMRGLLGNAVPLRMARALARAVKDALEDGE